MADYKLVTVIGIHPKEHLIDGDPEKLWDAAVSDPNLVFAVLYKGGHIAPLSGQSFSLVRTKEGRFSNQSGKRRA